MSLRRFPSSTVRLRPELLEDRLVPATFTAAPGTIDDLPNSTPLSGSGTDADPFVMRNLRSAVVAANENPGADIIVLTTGTYTLSYGGSDSAAYFGDLDVIADNPLAVVGAGGGVIITASGTLNDRLFEVQERSSLSLSNLTLTGGKTAFAGGAVFLYGGSFGASLTLDGVTASGNQAADGGAIAALGFSDTNPTTVTITNSTISNNTATDSGGGVYSSIEAGGVTVTNTTIASNTAGGEGGGVYFWSGYGGLTVTNSRIASNTTTSFRGGGVQFSSGTGALTVTNSTVADNRVAPAPSSGLAGSGATGGGIAAYGTTIITDSTISGNTATAAAVTYGSFGTVNGGSASGGGLALSGGNATITGTSIFGNAVVGGSATSLYGGAARGGNGYGGGIVSSSSGVLSLTNSTVSGNRVSGGAAVGGPSTPTYGGSASGGGLALVNGAATLRNSTVYENDATAGAPLPYLGLLAYAFPGTTAGGGVISTLAGAVSLGSTVVAGNTAGASSQDATGAFTSAGNNLVQNPAGATGFGGTDLLGVDPLLGPLADNGGPTFTHALLAGSPALDAGANPLGLTTDQRGGAFVRTFGTDTDIGAFEFQPDPTPDPDPGATPTPLLAVGSGAGVAAAVKVFNADNSVRFTLNPYESTFTGGVSVATGDLTGDGVDDIVTGALTGGGPRVVVFDGATGAVVRDFFAFEAFERGGVSVAVGDVNGDGRLDLITGAGVGGGPRVRVFDFADLSTLESYFAFADTDFRGGVTVAFTDGSVVAGRGPGGPAEVSVFDTATGTIRVFLAYDDITSGVNVAAGNGLIATGPGGGGPRVRVFTPTGASAGFPDFFAFDGAGDGVRVGVGGTAAAPTLLVGAGPGVTGDDVIEYAADQSIVRQLDAFDPDPAGGVYVG